MKFVQPIREKELIDEFLQASRATRHGLRNCALFTLLISGGRRIGDMLALRVRDVVAGEGKRWQIVKRLRIREQKTGKFANMILHKSARKAIHEYLRHRNPKDLEEPLFVSQERDEEGRQKAVSRWLVAKAIKAASVGAGLEDAIATHSMRKTFGYHLYQKCKDITKIMKLLNHRDPGVTLAYIGITQDDLDDLIMSLDI